jgi:hypothetical protein
MNSNSGQIKLGGDTISPGNANVPSALPLLVPRIRRTNHIDSSLATDDLAVLTNPLDAGTHFHERAVRG